MLEGVVLVVAVAMIEEYSVVSLLLPKYACYSGNLPEVSNFGDIQGIVIGISSAEVGNPSVDIVHSLVAVTDVLVASSSNYPSLGRQQIGLHSQMSVLDDPPSYVADAS